MTTAKKILQNKCLRPSKRLSQSFLEDLNVVKKIIKFADINPSDIVVEIGAGTGIMTEEIVQKAEKVVALEIDPHMIDILRERFKNCHNIEIIQTNVLDYDFSLISIMLNGKKVRVMGNVPYHISSQILFRLIEFRDYITDMTLMFQKELADRISAAPGSKEYGIPSVIVGMYTSCVVAHVIPRQCFFPVPKVMSSVLKAVIQEKSKVQLVDPDFFMKTVKISFSKRRKTLLNNLRSLYSQGYTEDDINRALESTGIDSKRRGETLTISEFGNLANALKRSKLA